MSTEQGDAKPITSDVAVKDVAASDVPVKAPVKTFRISDLLKQQGPSVPKKDASIRTSSFKQCVKPSVRKPTKKVQGSSHDILWEHEKTMQGFTQERENLPKLVLQMESTRDLFEKIQLQKRIQAIQDRVEESAYLAKTADIVKQFKEMIQRDDSDNYKRDTKGSITKYIQKFDNVERERLTEEYCRVMNISSAVDPKKLVYDTSVCKECQGETCTSEGYLVCMECGAVCQDSVHEFTVTYKDLCDTTYKARFSYRRLTRFRETLQSLQGKEPSEIPSEVLKAVQAEISKEPLLDPLMLDKKKIKYYLQRLNLQSYYDHAPHILCKISGMTPVRFPPEVEDKFIEMFELIQDPFEEVRSRVAPLRQSFLSYPFCLAKFCELLGLHEYQRHFTLLKSADKLLVQDRLWRGICESLNWKFFPSTRA